MNEERPLDALLIERKNYQVPCTYVKVAGFNKAVYQATCEVPNK